MTHQALEEFAKLAFETKQQFRCLRDPNFDSWEELISTLYPSDKETAQAYRQATQELIEAMGKLSSLTEENALELAGIFCQTKARVYGYQNDTVWGHYIAIHQREPQIAVEGYCHVVKMVWEKLQATIRV